MYVVWNKVVAFAGKLFASISSLIVVIMVLYFALPLSRIMN